MRPTARRIPSAGVHAAERRTLLRRRFHAQRLSDSARLADAAPAVARAVVAVQAQELNAACLSLRVRSTALTRDAVVRALEHERSLAWTWLMRGTLHVCAAEDVRWLLSLFGPLNAARDARRRSQVGLDDNACARGVRVMRAALADGPLTRQALRETLLSRGVNVSRDPQALIHLIGYAASQGVIVVVPPVGRDNRFALLEDWLPRASVPSRDAAGAELARRYFSAFAPATVADFRTWAGVPAPMARRAVALIAGELEEVAGPEPGLLAPRGTLDRSAAPDRRPTVRLLPRWDTYLLGYRSRDAMLDREHAELVIGGGWFRPTICIDGHIEGGWELQRNGTRWRLEVTAFDTFSRAVTAGIRAEADAIAAFLSAPVALSASDLPPIRVPSSPR